MFDALQRMLDAGAFSIQGAKEKLEKAEHDPLFIIKHLFNPKLSQPFYEFPFRVFDAQEINVEALDFKDFELELFRRVKQYLENIDPTVQVELVSKNDFPSNFVITFDGEKILEFDIYRHKFWNALVESKRYHAFFYQQAKELYERAKLEYEAWKAASKKPRQHFWRIGNVFHCIFLTRSARKKIDNALKRAEANVEDKEGIVKFRKEKYQEFLQRKERFTQRYLTWKARFEEEFGYCEDPQLA